MCGCIALLACALLVAARLNAAPEAQQHTAGSEPQAAVAHEVAGSARSGEAHPSKDAHGGAEAEETQNPLPDPTARETYTSALWVVIIFVVLLIVLYPTAWKNVLAGLKAREQRIRKDIADAEATRKRAEETLREYNSQLATAENRVREMISKATADGEQVATTIRMRAQAEAEEIKERATRDIEAARKQAMTEFREYAATVATAAAEQILRRNLNADDQRDLVNRSLDQLESAGAR